MKNFTKHAILCLSLIVCTCSFDAQAMMNKNQDNPTDMIINELSHPEGFDYDFLGKTFTPLLSTSRRVIVEIVMRSGDFYENVNARKGLVLRISQLDNVAPSDLAAIATDLFNANKQGVYFINKLAAKIEELSQAAFAKLMADFAGQPDLADLLNTAKQKKHDEDSDFE